MEVISFFLMPCQACTAAVFSCGLFVGFYLVFSPASEMHDESGWDELTDFAFAEYFTFFTPRLLSHYILYHSMFQSVLNLTEWCSIPLYILELTQLLQSSVKSSMNAVCFGSSVVPGLLHTPITLVQIDLRFTCAKNAQVYEWFAH